MRQTTALVRGNAEVAPAFFRMTLDAGKDLETPLPGQFYTFRISSGSDPLLRRPLAAAGFDAESRMLSVLYQVRGRGTEELSGKRPGDRLDILGPLGKGFPMPPEGAGAVLVAGGTGLGPVLFLARSLAKAGVKAAMLFGCRSARALPDSSLFEGLGCSLCTDDGSAGFHGSTVDCLAETLRRFEKPTIYACGPAAMLRGCHELALGSGSPCFVSVEEVMACGVGACMGCALRSAKGDFVRACAEGPVFDSRELSWT